MKALSQMSGTRRAFTLIELLVVVAIMATMVTVGVVGLNASRGATQVFAAGRDVMAMIRRARSMALVTQKPVVITYSNESADEEPCASIIIQADRLFSSKKGTEAVETLSGEVVTEASAGDEGAETGETLEDVLSPESLPQDVTRGLRVKVMDESDTLDLPENETRRSKISIFSTAENVSRTLTAGAETKKVASAEAEEPAEAPFRVAFAVNGTVNPPHRIWIYRDGQSPDKGVCIHVDRFGEPKCEDFE